MLAASPLLAEAFNECRGNIFSVWENADTPDKREQCWHRLKALEIAKALLYDRINVHAKRP